MGLRSEICALIFGALLILVTFGDNYISRGGYVQIGNLDTIFGHGLWPVVDVIYPLAAITVFVLYGWSKKGKIRVKATTVLLFISFIAVLSLMIIDDISRVLQLNIHPSQTYWNIISWVYPIYSSIAFFLFGKANQE